MGKKTVAMDYMLMSMVFALVCIGIVMVYSASAVMSQEKFSNSYYFLIKQLTWAFIGVVLMLVFSQLDYNQLQKISKWAILITIILLIIVLFRPSMLGARRWLKLGPIGFQPSEMAKLVLIIFIADIIDRKQSKNKEFKKCVLPVLIITGIFSLLIYIEPDLGNTVILAVLFMVMLFVGGAKIRHLLSIILCAMPLLYIAVLRVGYRKGRLLAFLNPEDDIMGKGYHLYQSLIAFGSGGLFGKGLGASTSKLFFLPQPHTDFILAIIGEELGFAGVSVIIILFALILYRGIRIALGAPNLFGTMMAVGISSLIAMQTIINIAVVTACIPTKGLPLPFLSFGGSSLIFNLIGIGIMLNISMHMRK